MFFLGDAAWSYSHTNNELANFNFDKEDLANSILYFMRQADSTFTSHFPLVNILGGRTVTWPRDPAAVPTFKV